MIWETQIVFENTNNKGQKYLEKANFIVENENTFSQVEETLKRNFGLANGFDILAIKVSKIKEIINEKPKSEENEYRIYFATIVDHFFDVETEKTKDIKYQVALFAHNIQDAHVNIEQYIKQGFEDMELKAIRESKYLDVIR